MSNGKTVNVNDSNFNTEVLGSDLPVLVDFWAEWCGPCRTIGPIIDEIALEKEGVLKVCKVNVEEAPNTASEYGIMNIPALKLFKDGKVVQNAVGALPKAELMAKISPYL